MNEKLLKKTIDIIQQHRWKRLLLAVSGGLDSICLAHFFICNKEALGIEWIGIAHVHHGLREGTADRDAEFVKNFADKYKCDFYLKKLDGESLKAAGGSLEEKARDARYGALGEFVAEVESRSRIKSGMTEGGALESTTAIVTAHHADDQAETLYLRLRRGVGLSGLRGIQQERDALFRPFLSVTREELRDYARENSLDWCEDESNSDTKFARNLIRHESLPRLEEICPGASQQLCRIGSFAGRVYSKVLAKASLLFDPAVISPERWPFDVKYACYGKVLALDLNTFNAVFERRFRTKSGMTARNELGMTEGQSGMTAGFAELFRLWLSEKGFRLPLKEKGTSIPYPFQQRQQCKTTVIEKSRHLLWIYDISSFIPQNPANDETDNLYFNTDKFSGLVGQWRYRKKGDVLWPADEKIKARKLEQWLREQGIPQWMYDSLPLYASESRVLFVEGVRRIKS